LRREFVFTVVGFTKASIFDFSISVAFIRILRNCEISRAD